MSSTKVFYAIQDAVMPIIDVIYDNVGNVFNYSCIVLGFFGLFFWLNKQKEFNEAAKNNPNQIK